MSNSTDVPPQPSRQSHHISDGYFTGFGMMTLGNTSRGNANSRSLMPGHTFERPRFEHCGILHIGNTGNASEGHRIIQPEAHSGTFGHVGDFRDDNAKRDTISEYMGFR